MNNIKMYLSIGSIILFIILFSLRTEMVEFINEEFGWEQLTHEQYEAKQKSIKIKDEK